MSIRTLTMFFFILAPISISHARECRTGTASAPLHVTVGGGHACAQKIEVKVCAPAGKKIKSSSIRDQNISPNIELDRQIQSADENCVAAKLSVWSRDVIGPPFLEYCPEGAYEGAIEVAYCH